MMVAAKCSVIVFSVITAGLFLLTQCVEKADDEKPVIKNAFGEQFAGSAACVSCHKETTESHKKTASNYQQMGCLRQAITPILWKAM